VTDGVDETKRIMFNAAGGTTNTRTMLSSTQTVDRTISLPDATDTLVGKATTDTLTNKTLTSPTLTTPILGTPSSGTLSSCTGLPISTGVSGLGTGVATALAVNTGSAGAPVLFNGALGTPTSGTVTNLTGTASININGTVGATTASTGAFTTLSATGATFQNAVADTQTVVTISETGTRSLVLKNPTTTLDGVVETGTNHPLTIGGQTSVSVKVGAFGSRSTVGTFSSTGLVVTSDSVAGFSTPITATNPSTNAASASKIAFNGGGTVWGEVGASYNSNNPYMAFFVRSGSEKMRITDGGNVGIGATSPAAKLHVRSSSSSVVELLRLDNSGNAADNGAKITWANADQAYDAGYISVIRNASLLSQDMVFATSSNWTTTAPSEKVRITGAGNVGIGTTSPAVKLDVAGFARFNSVGNWMQFDTNCLTCLNNDGAFIRSVISTEANPTYAWTGDLNTGIFTPAADTLAITTGGNERARFSSTGLAVTGQLAVGGATEAASIRTTFTGNTIDGISLKDSADQSNAVFAAFRKADGASIGSITRVTTTNAVVYNTTSDGRLKENLRDFTDSGRLIDSLKPRVFDWKNSDENGKNVVGFIAQEEHAADPIFAHIGAVSVGDEDPETITKQWQRSDSALIPILVAELKALRQRVAALESN
jgi:hypothetical protein